MTTPDHIAHIRTMAHNELRNYAIPGLSSSLIGHGHNKGTVRLFECSRNHHEPITPHSHRFDFQCLVLKGSVHNILWMPALEHEEGDYFAASELIYGAEPGKYSSADNTINVSRYTATDQMFHAGDWYGMRADEIHSIFFSRDAVVLFFEGPNITDTTTILEPWVNGQRIPTFKVEDWMFDSNDIF